MNVLMVAKAGILRERKKYEKSPFLLINITISVDLECLSVHRVAQIAELL